MPTTASILWRRLDTPGHEAAWLTEDDHGHRLCGTAVFAGGQAPCALSYDLICDDRWVTRSLRLTGRRGSEAIDLTVTADRHRRWWLHGREVPAVSGCVDLDLSFSAATNVFPLRRLRLPVGGSATVTSAWLTFPQLCLEPLPQFYRRTSELCYAYEAPTLGFATELRVRADGLIMRYPPLWTAQTVEER